MREKSSSATASPTPPKPTRAAAASWARQVVLDLHRLICGNLQPDLTLLLLPSFDASLARARRRNTRDEAQTGKNENRFEQEQDAFHRRVWEKYREIAAREPDRVVLIQGDLTIDEIHEQIVEAVAERLLLAASSMPTP